MNGRYKRGVYVYIKFDLEKPFVNGETAIAYLAFKGILERVGPHILDRNREELEGIVAALYNDVAELRKEYEKKELMEKEAQYFHLCVDCDTEIDIRRGTEGVDFHKGKDGMYRHAKCPTLKPNNERDFWGDNND